MHHTDDIRARRDAANRKLTAELALTSREEWEAYRDGRIKKLKASLGTFPQSDLNVRVTKTLKGDGFEIDNLLYESRPGLMVTANLSFF